MSDFEQPRESGYECGTLHSLHLRHKRFMAWKVGYLFYIIYHISHTYTMNNPAITNLVISLGGMQGMPLEAQACSPQLTNSRTKAAIERPGIHRLLANRLCRFPRIGFAVLLLHHLEGRLILPWSLGPADSQIRRRNDLSVLKYVNPPSAVVSSCFCEA